MRTVTTTYNLNIEGVIVGKRKDSLFNRWYVLVKLNKPFGLHQQGAIIEEDVSSLVYKNSLKFNKYGNGLGIGPMLSEISEV